jgi:anti-anti-sigma factor
MYSIPLPVQFRNGYAVAVQPAEIDVTNASVVSDTLLALLNCGTPGVVADMAGTRFCDLAGMRAIVRAQRRAQAVGARLGVIIPRPAARRVFTLTGADALIRFFPSLEVALAVLPGTAAGHGPGRRATDHGRMTGQPDRLRSAAFSRPPGPGHR